MHTVSEDFVFKELSHLNPSKSTGLDNIPARFIKDAAIFFLIPITYIINMSIVQNKVPEELLKLSPCIKREINLKLVILDLLVF